jgi:hypothetical protein
MPKVTFVNEHRHVEVDKGRLLSDIAYELGIATCREEFAGTGFGDYTVWIEGDKSALSPPTWYERVIKRCKGMRRMANKAKVLGDIKVWTQGGLGSRLGVPRPLDPAARAGEDGSEMFDHENDAAGNAWHVYGHPHAVGEGKRDPKVYVPPVKKTRAKKAKPKVEAKPKEEAAAPKDEAQPKDALEPKPEAAEAKPEPQAKPEAADKSADGEAKPDADG